MRKIILFLRGLLAIQALVVGYELLNMWLVAYSSSEHWNVLWSFQSYFPHEPWVDLMWYLTTLANACANLVFVGYNINKR